MLGKHHGKSSNEKTAMLAGFTDELEKIALGTELLSRAAKSRGVDPSTLGAIKQFAVKKTLQGPQAARDHAHRIVDFLKTQPVPGA